jgi:predicted amidohydrolase YtcJ
LVCRYEILTKEVDHVGLGQDRLWSAVRRLDWEKMAAIVKAGGGRWGAVTALADGSLGSRTAVFRDGYTDAHDQHGVRVTSLADLKAYVGGVI